MKPFRRETGVMAPLPRANVDTDQIIPKQFLKRIERTGYGPSLFFDWRYQDDGTERSDFVLNQEPFRDARFLVAGRNFGCGSSREHAVWALQDFGIRAVIAPSFADIFKSNAGKMGLVTVELAEEEVSQIVTQVEAAPGRAWTVDLEAEQVGLTDEGSRFPFHLDPFVRYCILEGLDDIGQTLQHAPAIAAFEAGRPAWMPDLLTPPRDRAGL
jgi:3-isopropylmalate/(R)-2-methylmalate dehydratase small subunit